jgi:hypothetical protein
MTKKKISTIRVGDVILNSVGTKIGVSRMDAEVEGGVIELGLFEETKALVEERLSDEPVGGQVVKVWFKCVFEAKAFSVWQTFEPDETVAKFLLKPGMFIVPDEQFVDDAEKDVRAVERVKEMAKSMGILEAPPYSSVFDHLSSFANYKAERERAKNARIGG